MSPSKSENFNLTPDRTPGSGLNSGEKQKVEVFSKEPVPFRIPGTEGQPIAEVSRRSAIKEHLAQIGDQRETPDDSAKAFKSPRLNVKQYHSSKPKFKEKLSANQVKQVSADPTEKNNKNHKAEMINYVSFGSERDEVIDLRSSNLLTHTGKSSPPGLT